MNVIVREARTSDAQQLIDHVQRLLEEPDIDISLSPGEFDLTVEEEQDILARYAASENSVYLVAEVEERIVGSLICTGGRRRATRHVVTVGGMSVAQEWRNQGIGTRLMARALAWAHGAGTVKRLELSVFARNEAAIHLYRSFGFVVEGRRRKAIYRDGDYMDDLTMGKLLLDEQETSDASRTGFDSEGRR